MNHMSWSASVSSVSSGSSSSGRSCQREKNWAQASSFSAVQ